MNRKATERQSNRNTNCFFSRPREVNKAGGEMDKASTGEKDKNQLKSSNNIIKTSTPKKDERPCTTLNISNVSNISFTRSSLFSSFQRPQPPSSSVRSRKDKNAQKTKTGQGNSTTQQKLAQNSKVVQSEETLALMNYNVMLQAITLNKLLDTSNHEKQDEIDKELASLRKEISEKQEMVNKNREHIRKIKALAEQQSLLNQCKKDIKDATGHINKFNLSNNPKQSKAVTKELERMRNKIEIENIAIPQNTSDLKLHESIKKALSSYEKLNKEPLVNINETKEMKDSLMQFGNFQREIDDMHKSCSDRVPNVASLVVKNCSNQVNDEKDQSETENKFE